MYYSYIDNYPMNILGDTYRITDSPWQPLLLLLLRRTRLPTTARWRLSLTRITISPQPSSDRRTDTLRAEPFTLWHGRQRRGETQ